MNLPIEDYSFNELQELILQENLSVHPSEIHGAAVGLLCGNKVSVSKEQWLLLFVDLFQDITLSERFRTYLSNLQQLLIDELSSDEYVFEILIADDEELPIMLESLTYWVQGFLFGIVSKHHDIDLESNYVSEVIRDFTEIAAMENEVEPSENNENAFYEISEYVRMAAITCYTDLTTTDSHSATSHSLH